MALSEEFLYELKQNNDIVSVMGDYVPLKRASRDYVCVCPFHSDKNPSLHVYTESQSFFCFGCGAGGDTITFIRLIENLDYMESVRFLAQRAGMNMPEDADDSSARARQRILEMNRVAGKYFHKVLFSPVGKEGLDYLTNRGLTINTIKTYGLGYAENDFHKLHYYMKSLGYSEDELIAGSLIGRNNNKVYDKFRHRVMFPIFDRRGNVIAFGGRALEKEAQAKYLNSDETLVFKKRQNLFSLNYAKNAKSRSLILCEGYMDVISVFQAGFHNVIATLGTAITPEQARLMKQQGFDDIIICYDSDEAGQKATAKAINLFSDNGITARVINMQGAKDPDEFIKKYGAEAFKTLLDKSGSAIDFEMKKLRIGLDMNTPEGKSAYLKKAVVLLAQIRNTLDRAVYISQSADLTGIPIATIENSVKYEMRGKEKQAEKDERKKLTSAVPTRDRINPEAEKLPREAKAERGIICFLINNPDFLPKIAEKISENEFPTSFNRRVYIFIKNRLENGLNADITAFNEEFSVDEVGKITGILNEFRDFARNADALNDLINILIEHKKQAEQKSAGEMSLDELKALSDSIAAAKK